MRVASRWCVTRACSWPVSMSTVCRAGRRADLTAGFAELERLAAAGKLLAAGRLVASGAGPGDDSFRDVDAWLASVSGTTVGAARAATKAGKRVLEQPVVAVGGAGGAPVRRAGRAGHDRGRRRWSRPRAGWSSSRRMRGSRGCGPSATG